MKNHPPFSLPSGRAAFLRAAGGIMGNPFVFPKRPETIWKPPPCRCEKCRNLKIELANSGMARTWTSPTVLGSGSLPLRERISFHSLWNDRCIANGMACNGWPKEQPEPCISKKRIWSAGFPASLHPPRRGCRIPRKSTPADTGLVSAIGRADGSDLGHRLENLVFLKLLSLDASLSHYVDLKEATLVTRSQRDVANLGGRFLHIVPAHEFLLQG